MFRIVDSRAIDAAVARAGGHADLRILLDEENILPVLRNGLRDGAADDATTDNQNVGLVHGSLTGPLRRNRSKRRNLQVLIPCRRGQRTWRVCLLRSR